MVKASCRRKVAEGGGKTMSLYKAYKILLEMPELAEPESDEQQGENKKSRTGVETRQSTTPATAGKDTADKGDVMENTRL